VTASDAKIAETSGADVIAAPRRVKCCTRRGGAGGNTSWTSRRGHGPHAVERAWPCRAAHVCTRRYSLPNSDSPNLHPMINEMTKPTAPMIVAIIENILALLECS
jgi:hypothetical protein